MFTSCSNDDQALAGMQAQGKCKRKMLWADRVKDRIRRFLKTSLRTGVPATGKLEAEAGIQAYPYVPLPGATEFRAVLASEYDKAAQSQKNLAVLYVDLPDCPPERQEAIGVLLCSVTKTHQTVFLYSPTCFAIIFRKMGAKEAALFSFQVLSLVQLNFPEVLVRLNIAAYPKSVKDLGEFEARAPGFVPTLQHDVLIER